MTRKTSDAHRNRAGDLPVTGRFAVFVLACALAGGVIAAIA